MENPQPEDIIDKILSSIERLLKRRSMGEDKFEEIGKARLRKQIEGYVSASEPLLFVLPAFPMKSPSLDKVIGSLPDRGEELALIHLNDFLTHICSIYEPGARLTLVSDGITYEDMLGIPSSIVLPYNQAIRDLASRLDLKHITFERVSSMLKRNGIIVDVYDPEDVQKALWTFLPADYDVKKVLEGDENILRVYRGFIRFLTKDLAHEKPSDMSNSAWKKKLECKAKEMIWRGECFSRLIAKSFPTAIRLSIHGHNNSGPKYGIKLMSRVSNLKTPWHGVVCEHADGSIDVVNRDEVDESRVELIERDGRPWQFRERNEDFNGWPDSVRFETMLPFGLKIETSRELSLCECPLDKLRSLGLKHSLVVLRGFTRDKSQDSFRSAADGIGEIQRWVFGDILVVKDTPNVDLNNVLTKEAMPFHFDGNFKLKQDPNTGLLTPDPPLFQFFRCENPGVVGDGYTLFSETSTIVEKLSTQIPIEEYRCNIFTPANESFGGKELQINLVDKHPVTGKKIIRFHEPWTKSNKTEPTFVSIDGLPEEKSDRVCKVLTDELYLWENCFKHKWTQGDYVLADNFALMHTRTAFKDCDRELWRIHLN